MTERPFIPGLRLSELFYQQAVRLILERHFPGLVHSAGRLGTGSDVLGFDTPQSMDHDWGPRVLLFLRPDDHTSYCEAVDDAFREALPREFLGHNVFYEPSPGLVADGRATVGEQHHVSILTVRSFFRGVLGFDPREAIGAADWLAASEQHLLSLTSGGVFHDGLGELEIARSRLAYYPQDVWLYLLAAQWRRIEQEEAFMGRCAQVGDEIGSRLVAARLVRDLMRLCFLMERRYAPYIKWFGTAFARLECAEQMSPSLTAALQATTWQEREEHLSTAYQLAAEKHNELGITGPLTAQVSPFWDRPFAVIHGDRFVEAIRAEIRDEEVRALPEHLGSVDQFTDSTDALHFLDRLRGVYLDPQRDVRNRDGAQMEVT